MKVEKKNPACLSTLLAACTALLLAESPRPPATLAPVAGKNVNSCVAVGTGPYQRGQRGGEDGRRIEIEIQRRSRRSSGNVSGAGESRQKRSHSDGKQTEMRWGDQPESPGVLVEI